jgi:hypothetical protein
MLMNCDKNMNEIKLLTGVGRRNLKEVGEEVVVFLWTAIICNVIWD